MQRIRIGIIGTGSSVEWAILPALLGPDILSPPDSGAWWSRRPSPAGDIRYQPGAAPEVVALCEASSSSEKSGKIGPRLEILGRAAPGAALYASPRAMLREMPLDALIVVGAAPGEEVGAGAAEIAALVSSAPGARHGIAPPRWLWIEGAPAQSVAGLGAFARASSGGPSLWIAAPLRRAAAHRAARRLLERDGIGAVTAIQARFPFALDTARFDSAYSAFDLLLSFVEGGAGAPRQVWAARHVDGAAQNGAAQVLMQLAGGATVSALFGASDAWNAPLPRLEICGTEGRALVCEAGRRLWHYVPREGARLWEPPGLAAHVSSSNLSGYGEDLKAFLAVCVNNPAPFNAERALGGAARALGALEAILLSVQNGNLQPIEARGALTLDGKLPVANQDSSQSCAAAPPRNLTLELG